jgi:hypothetical protein
MEKGLKRFYPTLKSNTDALEIKQFYQGRVAVEQIHSGSLFDLNKKVAPPGSGSLGRRPGKTAMIGTRYLLRDTMRQTTLTEREYGNIRIYRLK